MYKTYRPKGYSFSNRQPRINQKPAKESVDWEARLLNRIREAGLPEPVREYHFAEDAGRKWSADFAYPEERILIEFEGAIFVNGRHSRGKGYEEDCRKYDWAALLGWQVLRFASPMVESGEAIELLKVAFGLPNNALALSAKGSKKCHPAKKKPGVGATKAHEKELDEAYNRSMAESGE